MKPPRRRWMLVPAMLAAVACLAWPQAEEKQGPIRLPNGKMQTEEILKSEHEANLKDAARLVQLAEELKQDLEKNDRHVLSMATLKKTDELEKLVRRIRNRMRRH